MERGKYESRIFAPGYYRGRNCRGDRYFKKWMDYNRTEDKKFEQEIAQFCGTTKAACLSSATTCMEMTLRAMGIGPGDEVITSAYTFTATCSVICHVGQPCAVDTMPDSIDMDPEKYGKLSQRRRRQFLRLILQGLFIRIMTDCLKL